MKRVDVGQLVAVLRQVWMAYPEEREKYLGPDSDDLLDDEPEKVLLWENMRDLVVKADLDEITVWAKSGAYVTHDLAVEVSKLREAVEAIPKQKRGPWWKRGGR